MKPKSYFNLAPVSNYLPPTCPSYSPLSPSKMMNAMNYIPGFQQPMNIFNHDTEESKGSQARMQSFVGALAITDMVKTTLGPMGMDKILQSMSGQGNLKVTNDGATILKNITVDNAAAKVLINIAKVQDDEVGDGTTSVTVLAGELLRQAEILINHRIHPQTIIQGWRAAVDVAAKALAAAAVDNGKDSVKFRQDLINIARTTLSSKVLAHDKDYFAELCVDAVLRLHGNTNLDFIHIVKKPGASLRSSYLEAGFILDKKIGIGQPKRIENARILIANTSMDTDKVKIFGSRVKTDSYSVLADIEAAEKDKMTKKCERIMLYNPTCFINRQLIYNFPEMFFSDRGVMAIEHADFDGIERLCRVLGGEIVSTFDDPDEKKLGHCSLIEETMIGEDTVIRFSGVAAGEACTLILRGASNHVLDEAERAIHDALCVLTQTVKETRTLLGGGCAEMIMARAVDELREITPGKQALAVESFATALRQLPTIIADNAGFDSAELVARLRAEHAKGNATAGLDVVRGDIGDMRELGICESWKLKNQVLHSAAEAAEMIVRVDEVIKSAPRQRQGRY